MEEQEKTDEEIRKFIEKYGQRAWIEYLGTGKKPIEKNRNEEENSKKDHEWYQKNFGG